MPGADFQVSPENADVQLGCREDLAAPRDNDITVELGFYFPPEDLRVGLLVSVLSVWLLVGLFAYLNHFTKRRYFTIWTAAWLFYALWLTLNFCPQPE